MITVSSNGKPIRLVVMFIIYLVDLPSTTLNWFKSRPADESIVGLAGQTFNGTQRKLLNLLEEFDPGSD